MKLVIQIVTIQIFQFLIESSWIVWISNCLLHQFGMFRAVIEKGITITSRICLFIQIYCLHLLSKQVCGKRGRGLIIKCLFSFVFCFFLPEFHTSSFVHYKSHLFWICKREIKKFLPLSFNILLPFLVFSRWRCFMFHCFLKKTLFSQ